MIRKTTTTTTQRRDHRERRFQRCAPVGTRQGVNAVHGLAHWATERHRTVHLVCRRGPYNSSISREQLCRRSNEQLLCRRGSYSSSRYRTSIFRKQLCSRGIAQLIFFAGTALSLSHRTLRLFRGNTSDTEAPDNSSISLEGLCHGGPASSFISREKLCRGGTGQLTYFTGTGLS